MDAFVLGRDKRTEPEWSYFKQFKKDWCEKKKGELLNNQI